MLGRLGIALVAALLALSGCGPSEGEATGDVQARPPEHALWPWEISPPGPVRPFPQAGVDAEHMRPAPSDSSDGAHEPALTLPWRPVPAGTSPDDSDTPPGASPVSPSRVPPTATPQPTRTPKATPTAKPTTPPPPEPTESPSGTHTETPTPTPTEPECADAASDPCEQPCDDDEQCD